MKLNKRILLVTSMFTLVLYGSSIIYGLGSSYNGVLTEDTKRGYFKRNENNQTYGTFISNKEGYTISEPELIAVEGVGGVKGYAKKSDLYDESFQPQTPEEFLNYVEERDKKGPRTIPVYELDGETIIGEFRLN